MPPSITTEATTLIETYFRNESSYWNSENVPSSEPIPVKTFMVKAAIIGLLVSLSVGVIGALVFAGVMVKPRKKRKEGTKSLEVKNTAGWGPLRLMDILPFSNQHSQTTNGGGRLRYGGGSMYSISSSNSTLKTHLISKTPTHSGEIFGSSPGPDANAGAGAGGGEALSRSTLSMNRTTAEKPPSSTSSTSSTSPNSRRSNVRIRTPLVNMRAKMKSLIKLGATSRWAREGTL